MSQIDRRQFLRSAALTALTLPASIRASCLPSPFDSSDIYLSVDFFVHRPPDDTCGYLWMILRPHVFYLRDCASDDGLDRYVANLATPDKLSYGLWSSAQNAYPQSNLEAIHVSLPAGVAVDVQLVTSDGNPSIAPLKVDRHDLFRISAWDIFLNDNYAEVPNLANAARFELRNGKWTPNSAPPDRHAKLGHIAQQSKGFPAFFDDALRQQYLSSADGRDKTAKWLDLQLAHGVRRRVRRASVMRLDDRPDLLMQIKAEDARMPAISNIHSLLGLTYRLGRLDDANLSGVNDIVVTLKPTGAGDTPLSLSANDSKFIGSIFSGLKCMTPTAATLSGQWNPTDGGYGDDRLARSIFVQSSSRPFIPAFFADPKKGDTGPVTFVAVRRETVTSPDVLRLEQARIVDTRENASKVDLTGTAVNCFRAFRLILEPYRQFNSGSKAPQLQRVVRLVPVPEEEAAFWNEWRQLMRRHADGPAPPQAIGAAPLQALVDLVFPKKRLGSDPKSSDFGTLTWLGCFDLPWDRTDRSYMWDTAQPTILLIQSASDPAHKRFDADVILFAARGSTTMSAEPKVKINKEVVPGQSPSWIAAPPVAGGRANTDVNSLEIALPVDKVGAPAMTPTATYAGEYDFELAQSVGITTARLLIDYTTACKGATAQMADEISNHVALNIYAGPDEKRLTQYNPDTEFYPWSQEGQQGACASNSRYRVQLQWPTEPNSAQGRLDWKTARTFADTIYSAASVGARKLKFAAEGTYGTELAIQLPADQANQSVATVRTPADWPVAHPADVLFERNVAQADGATALPFLFVEPNSPDTTIKLVLDGRLLQPRTGAVKDPREEDARLWRSWRSVAELAGARNAEIGITGYRFSFRASPTGGVPQIIDGITQLPEFSSPHDVTQELARAASSLLTTSAIDPRIELASIALPKDISKHCHFYTVTLKIGRPPALVPEEKLPQEWNYLLPKRGVEDTVDSSTSTLRGSEAAEEFLRVRRDAMRFLKAANQSSARQKALRTLLGGRGINNAGSLTKPGEARGEFLVVPAGIADPADTTAISPTCIVLAFRPPERVDLFGDSTYRGLRRTTAALDRLLNGPSAETTGFDRSALANQFESLARQASGIIGVLGTLCDLVIPVHDPEKVDGEGADQFKTWLQTLESGDAHRSLALELRERVLQRPGLYCDAKAFMWVGLSDAASRLPDDAVRLRFSRKIENSAATVDLPLAEWLRGAAAPADWVGTLDVLHEAECGSHFRLGDFQVDRLEALLHASDAPPSNAAQLSVTVDRVLLQHGAWHPKREKISPSVLVPSREPVASTTLIAILEESNAAQALPPYIKRTPFLAGRDVVAGAKADHDVLERVAQSKPLQQLDDGRIDERPLAIVFEIRGDEDVDPLESLANDLIEVELSAGVQAETADKKPGSEKENKVASNKEKATVSPLDQFMIASHPESLPDFVDTVLNQIVPALTAPRGSPEKSPSDQEKGGQKNDRVRLCVAGNEVEVTGPTILKNNRHWLRRVSLLLSAADRGNARRRVYLSLGVSLPVWSVWSISVRQLRNLAICTNKGEAASGFRREFLSVGRDFSATMPMSKPIMHRSEVVPAPLSASERKTKLQQLIQKALVDPKILAPGDGWAAASQQTSLTIYYVQTAASAKFVVTGTSELRVQADAAPPAAYQPVENGLYIQEATANPDVIFPSDADDFAIDLEWRELKSPNRLILRIEKRRIRFG